MGKYTEQIQSGDLEIIKAVDPWAWTYYNNMILNAGQYKVEGHEFQIDIFQSTDRRQCAKKSPQMAGFTEVLICRILHKMIHGLYKQGALYLFPTSDEVSDFSKSRFGPFIKNNYAAVGRHIKNTDSTNVKQILDAFLFFRGARMTKNIEGAQKTSSKLKSLPVDFVGFDEYDEMDMSACQQALTRMDHSEVQEEFYLANPTVPDYGIDAKYQRSDQRVWALRCKRCGKHTCLELEFPNCLKRRSGKYSSGETIINIDESTQVFRACKHCGREVFPKDGKWIPQYPSMSKDMVGWWISHLNSAYTDPKTILLEYEDPRTDLVQFHNRRLGMAYIAAEDRLTVNQVYARCCNDPMPMRHDGPNCGGVDVNKTLNVLIGYAPHPGAVKILKILEVSSFQDVQDVFKKFNVRTAVFDLRPEERKVRGFRASVNYPVYGCEYMENRSGAYAWDERGGVVKVNRTEIFDATHELISQPGMCELPRRDSTLEEFAMQVCNTAKVLEEDKLTGSKVYRYRKLGAEHYRNALNYLHLATLKMGGRTMPITPQEAQKEDYVYD